MNELEIRDIILQWVNAALRSGWNMVSLPDHSDHTICVNGDMMAIITMNLTDTHPEFKQMSIWLIGKEELLDIHVLHRYTRDSIKELTKWVF